MAHDPSLWAPADLPGHVLIPETREQLRQVLNRGQAQLSRVIKLLNRFKVVMDADRPDAAGTGVLYLDTSDGRLYYDDPAASPSAWLSVNTFFNEDFTVWDDVRVAAEATKPGSSSPTWTNFTGSVSCWVFADSQSNYVEFSCQLPHKYKEESDIYPHVHWGPSTGVGGDVYWQLEYAWADIGSAFSGSTAITIADASSTTANDHQVASFAAIDGSGHGISSMLICKLTRLGSHANDTLSTGANFYEFDFHIECDSVGSDQEFIK
jgi:hypothetical protein